MVLKQCTVVVGGMEDATCLRCWELSSVPQYGDGATLRRYGGKIMAGKEVLKAAALARSDIMCR